MTKLNPKNSTPRQRRFAPMALATLIGMSSGMWLAAETCIPQVAQAYTARVAITLDWGTEESYETLIRRAEAAARAAAQRSFDSDVLVTDVAITIVGETDGAAAPILTLEVDRPNWRSRPDPQLWSTYYRTAEALLMLRRSAGTASTPAPAAPAAPSSTLNPGPPAPPVVPRQTAPTQAPANTPSRTGTQTTPSTSEPLVPPTAPPQINIPAAPSGQLGLPRSILQPQ